MKAAGRPAADAWGLAGVLVFSLSFPATRATVGFLDPLFVGLGRAAFAAMAAAAALCWARPGWPGRGDWAALGVVALGAVIGFPVASTLAMQEVAASHGAVVVGLLPLATAGAGALIADERPPRRFWAAGVLGSAGVVAFVLRRGAGTWRAADAWLLLAVLCGSLGYAVGGRLARRLGGWQVIAWALLLALPLTAFFGWVRRPQLPSAVPWAAWLGFAYVSLFSMFLGFVFWYRGLALGGIGRVGQIQLVQPFLTFAASAWLLGEPFEPLTLAVAAWVLLCVAWGRRG